MLIFVSSFIATVIISLCFFKSRIWDNRYLVLSIGAGVALVATLATNYVIRGSLATKSEVVWQKPIYKFYMPDSVWLKSISYLDTKDSLHNTNAQLSFIVDYRWYDKHDAKEFYRDTTKLQNAVSIVLYAADKKGKNRYFGVFRTERKQDWYGADNTYLASSGYDSLRYVQKKKPVYQIPPSKWLTAMSLPRANEEVIIFLPPKEYAMIPDSLIKKIPF